MTPLPARDVVCCLDSVPTEKGPTITLGDLSAACTPPYMYNMCVCVHPSTAALLLRRPGRPQCSLVAHRLPGAALGLALLAKGGAFGSRQ